MPQDYFKSNMINNENENFGMKADSDIDYNNLFRGLSTFAFDRLNTMTELKQENQNMGLDDNAGQSNEKTYADLADLVLHEQNNIKQDIPEQNIKYPTQVNPILTNSNILNQNVNIINESSMSSESSYATNTSFSTFENVDFKNRLSVKRLNTNKNIPSQSGVVEKPKRGRKPTPLNEDPNVKLSKKQLEKKNSGKDVVCFGNKVVEKNTEEYSKRRESNNIAVKKCREKLLEKQKEREDRMNKLLADNKSLSNTVNKLTQELDLLKNIIMQMNPDKKLPDNIINMCKEIENHK